MYFGLYCKYFSRVLFGAENPFFSKKQFIHVFNKQELGIYYTLDAEDTLIK